MTEAMKSQARALSRVASESLAKRRLRLGRRLPWLGGEGGCVTLLMPIYALFC